MKLFTAIGLMSGTSMDGIDVALIYSDGANLVERGRSLFVPYEAVLRQRIEHGLRDATGISRPADRPGDLAALENDITELHAAAVMQFLDTCNIAASEIHVIGMHGQTVLHSPQESFTVQLGDGQKLADITGIDVVYDLRANDMAHGGQGAPLVPVYHRALARSLPPDLVGDTPLVFVNIGGISNVTYVGGEDELIAFDCGPGNVLIDQWVQICAGVDFDKGGEIARGGRVNEQICDGYMAHPFFSLPIPKSLDRKNFEPLTDEGITPGDGARSLARVTASAILQSTVHFPDMPGTWIICGGGALNEVIMDDLRTLATDNGARGTGAKVITADEAGLSSMAMEAEAFAYLAIRSLLGKTLTFPTTTGCKEPVTGGKFVRPRQSPVGLYAKIT